MDIAGLDIGTTQCKCAVFDENGREKTRVSRDYAAREGLGAHETDARDLADAVFSLLREAASRCPDIGGIGVTSFGEAFVAADGQGAPLCPVMRYTDPRGAEECKELSRALGERTIAGITGLRPHPMYSLPKMMWLKRRRPDVFARAAHLFLIQDYIVYLLTGQMQIDYSLASRTMAFDIRKLSWSRTMFDAAGIDAHLMSRPVPPGADAGAVLPETARRTGLSPRARVVSVGHDQLAAVVGAGAFDGTVAADGAGTTECLTPVFDRLPPTDAMFDGNFAVVPHAIAGKYITYAFVPSGGALLSWCADTLAKKEKEEAKREGVSVHAYLEQQYAARSDAPSGLLVLPHFCGAGTPTMDSASRGVIVGLTTETTVETVYRGCMEGIVYELLQNLEALGKNADIRVIHATGGGARSNVWMQMKADILNLPVVALQTEDAGTVGCAMLTGTAISVFRDLRQAADSMIARAKTYLPRQDRHEAYMRDYRRYRALYGAVRPLLRGEENE